MMMSTNTMCNMYVLAPESKLPLEVAQASKLAMLKWMHSLHYLMLDTETDCSASHNWLPPQIYHGGDVYSYLHFYNRITSCTSTDTS